MKTGRLSKKEKDFLDKNLKMDINELCNTLNRARDQVVEYVREQVRKQRDEKKKNKLNNIPKVKAQETTTNTIDIKNKSQSRAGELLARNEKLGVVVMTEASSSESDKYRKKPQIPSKYKSMIHKIKGE